MDWFLIAPWVMAFCLILLSFVLHKRSEKKFEKKIEEEMKRWIEKEFGVTQDNMDRRGARAGGRRHYDNPEET